MRFKQITVVGLGLIGGSFALAARRAGLAERITGWDSPDVVDQACALGVIDSPEESFESGGCQSDLIYLAAPVGAIVSILEHGEKLFRNGSIVTDAGSTKRRICSAAESIPSSVQFVGGHPMAGSHNTGLAHADGGLFEDAPYALVHVESGRDSRDAALMMEEVVLALGAKPVQVSAEEHDRIVARVSHTPQLLATSLARSVSGAMSQEDFRLTGSGFAETIRLAGSSWSVWEDICKSNSVEITLALDELISEIREMRNNIGSGDFESVGQAFNEANQLSSLLPGSSATIKR